MQFKFYGKGNNQHRHYSNTKQTLDYFSGFVVTGPNHITSETTKPHNRSIDLCKKIIDAAVLAGCDYVKFQKRNPDVCVPEHQKDVMRETPWGSMKYIDYKYKVEFEKKEYDIINDQCKDKGLDWSASVWDYDSLDFLLNNYKDVPFDQ